MGGRLKLHLRTRNVDVPDLVDYNIIDTLKKQCIIVTKDFLDKNTLKMDDINKLTCSVYRIQKAEGYNKNDLSTIRTTVVKVK